MEVKFIFSEKGKPLALLNRYKYRLIRTRKDGYKKWLCIQTFCYASIVTNGNLLHETAKYDHKHSENSVQSLERQVLRKNCKRKASGSISIRLIKIIRTELTKNVNSEIEHRDIRSIRKAMYDKRRQIYPAFPKSVMESIEQLKSLENNDVLKFKGDQFVFVPENKLFVCITTEQNLMVYDVWLIHQIFFADGTFNYAPKYYIHFYTINCLQNGFYIPMAYIFLTEKPKQTYIDMWIFLQELSEKLIFKRLVTRKLHLDFEISDHEACREVFPNVEIQACRFHLGQRWWRKINSEQQLRTSYTKDDELGKWVKLFFGLPFVPPHGIENAFVELVSISPNIDIGCFFSDYILHTYLENDCLFLPAIWAQEPSENPR